MSPSPRALRGSRGPRLRGAAWLASSLAAALTPLATAAAGSPSLARPESFAASVTAPTVTTLGRLADEALLRHPELRALRAAVDVQRARVGRAGALPDPMLMVEWSMLPLSYPVSLSRTDMSGVEVALQQELPFPGKLRFAQEAERRGIDVLRARMDETTWALRATVAQTYVELCFLDGAQRLVGESQRVLGHLARHAEAMASAGRSQRADLLRAQSETAMLKERIFSLEARRAAAEARMGALLSRPGWRAANAPLVPLALPPPLPPVQQLLADAGSRRPSLQAREAETQRAVAELRRAERGLYPNFLLGAAYRFRAGSAMDPLLGADFYSLRVGVTLPLWGAARSERRVAEATVQARRTEVEAERARVETEVRRLHAEVEKERRTLPLYADVLRPLAAETLRAAIPAYVAGKADFHSVLQTWGRVFETDLEQLRVRASVMARTAELEAAVGRSLGIVPELGGVGGAR